VRQQSLNTTTGDKMGAARSVMLLEFNELSPQLMERFIAKGYLPNFKRLRDESEVYVTQAAETGWDLNPWVQWVTVHSGLNYADHGITELDEGGKLKAKRVWDVVSDAGQPVCICGSMNVAYHNPIHGVIIPDPWTTKFAPYPGALLPFFRFVQQNVLDHTSSRVGLKRADYLNFFTFMMRHGLSAMTLKALGLQLRQERTDNVRWKRAALLDKLQFDVFRWYYRKVKPRFSTFFSNSTAHYQHYYWREMDPQQFKIQPTPEQRATYQDAILFGYQEMDKLIARLLALAGPDTVVLFATAISQQPCLTYEDQGGKVLYRPREYSRLLDFAEVTEAYTVAPVMAEVFNLHMQSGDEAIQAELKLRRLRVVGQPAMHLERKDAVISVKCNVHHALPAGTLITAEGGHSTIPFFDLFYQMEGIKSGMHHSDGMFWIRTPEKRHHLHPDKVPLASLAPTILRLLSLPCPAHMKAAPLPV
jgi:hypothetical protein